jgi:Zn-dependent protease
VTDLTLQVIILRLIAYVFIATVHGFAVAVVTVAAGDPGPRHDGRLSINPLTHLNLVGAASCALFSVGWIEPLAIDAARLRRGRLALALVVAAGAAATLAGAAALRLVRPFILPLLPDTASATAFTQIEIIGELSVWFALVNILPLPPLTGAHLLAIVAPKRSKAIAGVAPYAGFVLALAAATGIVTRAVGPAYPTLARLVFGG